MSLNEETGNYEIPIPDATITVYTYIEDVFSSKETIKTDENGYYSIDLVAAIPEEYYFTFECRKNGFIPKSQTVFEKGWDDEVNYCQRVDFNLQDANKEVLIQGTVIDAFTKMPISGANVCLDGATVMTDKNGCWNFQTPYKDIVNHEISASANGYIFWSNYNYYDDIYDIPTEDNVINISTELYRDVMLVHLKGVVIDKNTKNPVRDAKIYVYESQDRDDGWWVDPIKLVSTTTDSNGFYSCDFIANVIERGQGIDIFSYFLKCGNVNVSVGDIRIDRDYDLHNFGNIVVENGDVSIYAVINIEDDIRKLSDDAGIIDSIDTINRNEKATKHFDISGAEISPNAKGLHIVNGKKVVIK